MLLLNQQSTDPYFNIATEEYLLKNFTEDFFIIYRNDPSIIVGKHQNTIAEINFEFVRNNALPVIRRLSGGGTVYHDLGNINYSFITNGSEGNLIDFRKHTQPIIDVLQALGIEARIGGKNDIRIGDKKISGNAEHIYKNRVLHHGTLLFNSNLDVLNESIKINPNTYTDKAVKSIRSHVANISEYLKDQINIVDFIAAIANHINNQFVNTKDYQLSFENIDAINKLVETKYSTWDWNFGYSPSYVLNNHIDYADKELNINISVEKGNISLIKLSGNLMNEDLMVLLEKYLLGCPHNLTEMTNRLSAIELKEYLPEEALRKLLKGLI